MFFYYKEKIRIDPKNWNCIFLYNNGYNGRPKTKHTFGNSREQLFFYRVSRWLCSTASWTQKCGTRLDTTLRGGRLGGPLEEAGGEGHPTPKIGPLDQGLRAYGKKHGRCVMHVEIIGTQWRHYSRIIIIIPTIIQLIWKQSG